MLLLFIFYDYVKIIGNDCYLGCRFFMVEGVGECVIDWGC